MAQPIPTDLMTPKEVAELLTLHVNTLSYWRVIGEGPPYYRIGRRARYSRADVEKWVSDRKEETA